MTSNNRDQHRIPPGPFEQKQERHNSPVSKIVFVFRMLAAYAAGEQDLATLSSVVPAAPVEWPQRSDNCGVTSAICGLENWPLILSFDTLFQSS